MFKISDYFNPRSFEFFMHVVSTVVGGGGGWGCEKFQLDFLSTCGTLKLTNSLALLDAPVFFCKL